VNCPHCGSGGKKFGSFKNRAGTVQRYRCKYCDRTFNDLHALAGIRLDDAKVAQIVHLLTEGCGIRATARLSGCDKNTVLSVLRTVGKACEKFHDRVVRNITVDSLQLDELWARVGIRQKRTTKRDKVRGDFYTYLALERNSKLIVSHFTGKRDAVSTDFFIDDLAKRIAQRAQITTDAFPAYPDTIRRYFNGRADYAVMQKIYALPHQDLDVIDPIRRYSAPKCIGVDIEMLSGDPDPDKICTSHIERCNLSVRHFTKRFGRLGLGWSRKLTNHRAAVALFVVAYNFCKHHSSLATSPAVRSKLTDHVWTPAELLQRLSATI
jgi:transposase-like protein/IS1 family transposase